MSKVLGPSDADNYPWLFYDIIENILVLVVLLFLHDKDSHN